MKLVFIEGIKILLKHIIEEHYFLKIRTYYCLQLLFLKTIIDRTNDETYNFFNLSVLEITNYRIYHCLQLLLIEITKDKNCNCFSLSVIETTSDRVY